MARCPLHPARSYRGKWIYKQRSCEARRPHIPSAFAGSVCICRQRVFVQVGYTSGTLAGVIPNHSPVRFSCEAKPKVAAATVWSPIASLYALSARSSTPSKGGSIPCLTCQRISDPRIQKRGHTRRTRHKLSSILNRRRRRVGHIRHRRRRSLLQVQSHSKP